MITTKELGSRIVDQGSTGEMKAAICVAYFVDGKAIECKGVCSQPDRWHDAPRPVWNFNVYSYRVKPEPVELWVVVNSNGNIVDTAGSKERADANCFTYNKPCNYYMRDNAPYRAVLLREVV